MIKKITIRILIFIIMTLLLFFVGRDLLSQKYTSFSSPDGNFKMVLYSYPSPFAMFPGQGGGGPGYLKVYDKHTDKSIARRHISMMNTFPGFEWDSNQVVFFAKVDNIKTIHFPKTYPVQDDFKQIYLQHKLLDAISNRDTIEIGYFLNKGAKLKLNEPGYLMPLIMVSRFKIDVPVAKYLLRQQNYLYRLNNEPNEFISHFSGLKPEIIKQLVALGINPSVTFKNSLNAAEYALSGADIPQLKALLELGVPLGCNAKRTKFDYNRLHREKDKQKVRELLPNFDFDEKSDP